MSMLGHRHVWGAMDKVHIINSAVCVVFFISFLPKNYFMRLIEEKKTASESPLNFSLPFRDVKVTFTPKTGVKSNWRDSK